MHSLREDTPAFVGSLEANQPNLLLIGAMTPCLPGAVHCAEIAREVLGREVFIVLGGRHASETMYRSGNGEVAHHPGSPLRLQAEGLIAPAIDLVVSGEAEHVLVAIGEIVARLGPAPRAADVLDALARWSPPPPGEWIAGTCENGRIHTVASRGIALDHDALPAPSATFGITSAFDVFGGRPTAHVFSDTGPGCAYDCAFCSERRSVTGPLRQISTAPDRLYNQLRSAVEVVAADMPGQRASAFCEDSTLLGGSPVQLRRFIELMSAAPLDIRFGAQLTIDQILSRAELLPELHAVGLDYLFVGLETLDPSAIGGMSKDLGGRRGSWAHRTERVFQILGEAGIRCGAALLFGLGESRSSRAALFEQLKQWRGVHGMPNPISLNWAVQHPLRGTDDGGYRYHEWGIPPGPFIEAFADFGEASVRYPIVGQAAPALEEVLEIGARARELPALAGGGA